MASIDEALIEKLNSLSIESKPIIKYTNFNINNGQSLTSWKMNEHLYSKQPCPFPTLARGLFTKGNEIIVRGYDKFFNVGEVPWTHWSSLKSYTEGPYTLSFKENGCIIFIAALDEDNIIVTSKHALGPPNEQNLNQGTTISHAQVGEKWLDIHLKNSNRTRKELAEILFKNSWTAVAELCDDSFEEHVLPYPPSRRGLHLHGLNKNIANFQTEDFSIVESFANDWGFIKTRYINKNTIEEVEDFAKLIESQNGSINGEPIEGFVVRCKISSKTLGKNMKDCPPYDDNSVFFFKVKFDEPYLMYREWREITKGLLSRYENGSINDEKGLRRCSYPHSIIYKDWVKSKIVNDYNLFKEYNKNKGIILVRDLFLNELETSSEMKLVFENVKNSWNKKNMNKKDKIIDDRLKDNRPFEKIMLVPIAVPGCGKTAVSISLSKLFGFGHTQSDDVKTKKTGPGFERNVQALLKENKVVIADRNNHMKQHRERLACLPSETKPALPRTRMIALYWPLDRIPINKMIRICGDRIKIRGDRHQSLRFKEDQNNLHEEIITNFINQSEVFDKEKENYDDVIEMNIENDIYNCFKDVVNGLRNLNIDLRQLTQDEVENTINEVMNYNPEYKRPDEGSSINKKVSSSLASTGGPRYYAVAVEVILSSFMKELFAKFSNINEQPREFFNMLLDNDRVANVPHITIIHQKELNNENNKKVWDKLSYLIKDTNIALDFEFKVNDIVYNDKLMALSLTNLKLLNEDVNSNAKHLIENFISTKVLHVTVGTANSTIAPFEAKQLVHDYNDSQNDVEGIKINDDICLRGRLRGMF